MIEFKLENYLIDQDVERESAYFIHRNLTQDEKDIGHCCYVDGYRKALSDLSEKLDDEIENI